MTGLAFAQAPPPALPMRFLTTALAWGVVAGLWLAWHGDAVALSRWTPATLVLVHMFALGVLGNAMLGSLVQFLPVAAGSPWPCSRCVPWLHSVFNGGWSRCWRRWHGSCVRWHGLRVDCSAGRW